jgi:hypothetical protein
MDAKQHMELMRPELVHHLRNTVTVGTGPVTELRKAAADEIDRLRSVLAKIVNVSDIPKEVERLAILGATPDNNSEPDT